MKRASGNPEGSSKKVKEVCTITNVDISKGIVARSIFDKRRCVFKKYLASLRDNISFQ